MSDPVNRSGTMYSIPRDSNRVPAVGAVLSSDGVTVKPIELDGSGNLLVNVAAGGAAGTQYTDAGSAPAHPIGNAIEWNNAGTWATTGSAAPLPVTASIAAAQTLATVTTVSAVTAITNALPAGTNAIGNVGTKSAAVNVGQQTVNTTAVQISSSSTVPTNGILIKALSTNGASIFVGGSGVTTSNGYELVAGEATSFTANLNTLYIISAASTTDKICWNVE